MLRLFKRRTVELTAEQRATLRELVRRPKFEIIPLLNAIRKADELPPGSTVTVTSSPSHGIEATVELAEKLSALGHEVIPHLSAHMIWTRTHLEDLVARLREGGFRRIFVVGGDAQDHGDFHDGLMLLRAIDELGRPFDDIGVPAYPEGHPNIGEDRLLEVLLAKQRHASYMATQMSFNPTAIAGWIERMRGSGVTLPVHLGVPGVTDVARLMRVAARIGVADSARYLKKNRKLLGHVIRGQFGPDELLEELGATIADPTSDVRALHVFTFNQVEQTAAWQRRMLEELGS
ncbi:MAG TPA: methylenetetrahydrofolate reductase [Actinomycetota bacterium]|nr:methylenetetrahydrofolate reductase [Actinomycetota bacterium]